MGGSADCGQTGSPVCGEREVILVQISGAEREPRQECVYVCVFLPKSLIVLI